MANVFIEESTMQAIGDAIRAKTGKEEGILPENMPVEIDGIAGTTLTPITISGNWVKLNTSVPPEASFDITPTETATSVFITGLNWFPLKDKNNNDLYNANNELIINVGDYVRVVELPVNYPPGYYSFNAITATSASSKVCTITLYHDDTLVGMGKLAAKTSRTEVNLSASSYFNKICIFAGETEEEFAVSSATLKNICLHFYADHESSAIYYEKPIGQMYELPTDKMQITSRPLYMISNDGSNIVAVYYDSTNYYDLFWDQFQTKGTRTDYNSAFSGIAWNDATFKPKYAQALSDGTITKAQSIFSGTYITNIDYDLNFSNATTCWGAFNSAIRVRRIKSIQFNNSADNANIFASTKYLLTINEIKGAIDFNLSIGSAASLDMGTVDRIIAALVDHSTDGVKRTLTLNAAVKDLMSTEQKAKITTKGWTLA
jgi:hypothetical protein